MRKTTTMSMAFALLIAAPFARAQQHEIVVKEAPRQDEPGRRVRIDDLDLDLVWVKAGSFQMGSNEGHNREKPVATVRITQDYWMGRTEVTQAQWKRIMGDNPSQFNDDDLPVETVTWYRCVAFCEKLTDRERRAGRLPEGYVYRLPTEAEWEYAARGGAQGRNTQYAGSDDIDTVAWNRRNSSRRTHPVGTKAPNEIGLHDMSGNVMEWVHDMYQEGYSGLPNTDPTGPPSSSDRVRRGGSWFSDDATCRVAYRGWRGSLYSNDNLGFRVVLAPVLRSHASSELAEVEIRKDESAASSYLSNYPSLTVTLAPEVVLQMTRIPNGEFIMGSNRSLTERPQRKVRISRAFWMGQFKVTQRQFEAVTGRNPGMPNNPDRPVNRVSWQDAMHFIESLNEQFQGRYVFRLPSEAEWEYTQETSRAAKGQSGNAIRDMLNMPFEWCQDWFDLDYYPKAPDRDPPGPDIGQYRVLRGRRPHNRNRALPENFDATTGFRVAMTMAGQEADSPNADKSQPIETTAPTMRMTQDSALGY